MMPSTTKVLFWLYIMCVATLLAAGTAIAELVPKPLVIAADGLYVGSFAIAPDDSKVFFGAGPGIYAATELYDVPISGGPVTRRTDPANGFSGRLAGWDFSPDGRDVVFSEQDGFSSGDAYVLPIASGAPRQLTFDYNISSLPFWSSEFSRDGTRLLFLDSGRHQLFTVPLDGSTPPAPLNNPLSHFYDRVREDWKLLPGGNDVLYVAPQEGATGYNLFRVDAVGGMPMSVNFTEGLYSFTTATNSFAIDTAGSRVAYSVQQGPAGHPTIMSRSLAGGPEFDLTAGFAKHDDVHIELFGFARDLVIFQADFDSTYSFQLYAAPAGGGPAEVIGDAPAYTTISPDGNSVIFTKYVESHQEAYLFNVSTDSVRALGEIAPNSIQPTFQFNANGDYFTAWGSNDPARLFTADGDFVRSIPGYARFHPDGEHILYLDSRPGEPNSPPGLFMQRLDGAGGAAWLSNDKSAGTGIDNFAFTNDGSKLLYSRGDFGHPLELYSVDFVPEPSAAAIALTGILLLWWRRQARPSTQGCGWPPGHDRVSTHHVPCRWHVK